MVFIYSEKSSRLIQQDISINSLSNSGVGVFFLRQDARLSPAWPSSGNSLTICRLPFTKSTVPRTNTIVCLFKRVQPFAN
jgi:hypothetical protein